MALALIGQLLHPQPLRHLPLIDRRQRAHRLNRPRLPISGALILLAIGGPPVAVKDRVVLLDLGSNRPNSPSLLRVIHPPICHSSLRVPGHLVGEIRGHPINSRLQLFRILQRLLVSPHLGVGRRRSTRPKKRTSSNGCNRFVRMRTPQSYTRILSRLGKGEFVVTGIIELSFNDIPTVPLVACIPHTKSALICV